MKVCPKCHEPNADSVEVCDNCGAVLTDVPDPAATIRAPKDSATVRSHSLAETIRMKMHSAGADAAPAIQADVVFVLDCTGSMKGEIACVQTALDEFADEVQRMGVPIRIGLVAFRDLFEDEPMEVFELSGDVPRFQASLTHLHAAGGGDEPESSLDALMTALAQPFNAASQKVLVLITDAPPHIPDRHTRSLDDVKAQMERVGINQLYLVIPVRYEPCDIYTELLRSRHWTGLAFDLGKGRDFEAQVQHFKKTLLSLGQAIGTASLNAGGKTLPMS